MGHRWLPPINFCAKFANPPAFPARLAWHRRGLLPKVGSDQAKPQGLVWIPTGMEADFLAPLDVRNIPGIGRATEAALNAIGIRTVGQLAAIPLEKLEDSFGRWGTALYRKALGQDSYEFFVDAEPKSISHNETFGVIRTIARIWSQRSAISPKKRPSVCANPGFTCAR